MDPRRRRWTRMWIPLAIGVLIALRFVPRPVAPLRDPQQPHHVERVIDGDTLIMSGHQRVRLLGINTPELARHGKPAEPWSEAARDFLKAAVAEGEVSLGFDREPY